MAGAERMADFNGAAPGAKLAVYDFGPPDDPEAIVPPDDMYEDFYGHSYGEPKARISSNSWGYSSGGT